MYKVMVIDDEDNLRQALEQLLVSNGYAFCGARDAESGLELLASEHPDLLLLDVMLPGTNGFDLCARIREQGRRIPVIFLSAKCDIVDKSIGFRGATSLQKSEHRVYFLRSLVLVCQNIHTVLIF